MTKSKHPHRVSGTNYNAQVHPYERDTTMGSPELSGDVVHTDDFSKLQKIAIVSCIVCGASFTVKLEDAKPDIYCPLHKWIEDIREPKL